MRHFFTWCEAQSLELFRIIAGDVGRHLRQLSVGPSKKKGVLAALRRYFRVLVERHVCFINPAAETETNGYDVVEGKSPEISECQFRALIGAIDATTLVGLRDLQIIKTLAYTGARVGAVAVLDHHHFLESPRQLMLHFDEKRGKS